MAVIIFGIWLVVAAVLSCQQYAARRLGAQITWAEYLLCALWPIMLPILGIVFIRTLIQTLEGKR